MEPFEMIISIRQKLMFVFSGLFIIVAMIGVLTMSQINQLGQAIDVILRENYRSVIACQNMKESLERIDSGVLFSFAGNSDEGRRYIDEYTTKFLAALDAELKNITLAGEGVKADRIKTLFDAYTNAIPGVIDLSKSLDERQTAYFSILLPTFNRIKGLAQEILELNQANMSQANDAARKMAASGHRQMTAVIVLCAVVFLFLGYLARLWILRPINRLIESANEIRRGNLDIVLEARSHDEIGRLSESFNEMASALRLARKNDRISLARTRRAAEVVFKTLPTAVAVIDLDGKVEFSTNTADRYFGLKSGRNINELSHDWLSPLIRKAIDANQIAEPDDQTGYIQIFFDNREYFFHPIAVPIPFDPDFSEPTGAAVILKDVTHVYEQMELKQGVVSTLSHQLKTPLTSLQMSIHLLLEEKVGNLNEKQTDLLMAARDDTDRLVGIITDLLDIHRIKSGRTSLSLKPVLPKRLAVESIDPFLIEAKDKGITITNDVPEGLPEVAADSVRICHVFENLISNALRFTSPGGFIRIWAQADSNSVWFWIQDSGSGIAPDDISRGFEPFFRVAGQDEKSGVGLGLAIVKEIVRAHGGEVVAESETGKGSVFKFSLPLWRDSI